MDNGYRFRAWHEKHKKMFSPEEMGQDQLTLSVDGRGMVNVSGQNTSLSQFFAYIKPLMSTGLRDKDGVEIFEGDICTLNYGIPPLLFTFRVERCPAGLGFTGYGGNPQSGTMADLCDMLGDITVIGNEYENPELFDQEKLA